MSAIEVEVDQRGRASLKGAGVAPGRYRVEVEGDRFVGIKVTSHTHAELLAMTDPDIRQTMQDIRDGKTELVSIEDLL